MTGPEDGSLAGSVVTHCDALLRSVYILQNSRVYV